MRWLKAHWSDLRSGLWLFPGLIVASLIGLAFAVVQADRMLGQTDVGFGGGASAARDVLAAIAGSFVTVAGVTFSLTVVVLQLSSSQYSPRILRGFLADRITQLTAGAFVGVFAYALVVLRSVRGAPDTFVPSLGVSVAIVLSIAALALFLVFIDHVTKLIQVSNLAARIGADTNAELQRLRAAPAARDDGDARAGAWRATGPGLPVHARRPGYLRTIDVDTMARMLRPEPTRVLLLAEPGDLVLPDEPIAEVWRAEPEREDLMEDDRVRAAVLAGLRVANERDLRDDPGFGVRQLADVAIRALSPGINDPTTAVTCIAYVRAALVEEASLRPPARLVETEDVQIMLAPWRFGRDARALAEIAHHAVRDPRVAGVLEQAVAAVARAARRSGRGDEAERIEADYRRACADA
ncbi:MAG TPA: DUF2254 domain-containing protein [Gaiella sp.]|jgi:uncharacterized membrane protein|nr:DUF2254 domain-containing protein [Gaiella sp.]